MGGIQFIIYNNMIYTLDYIKSFMNIKSRGPNYTTHNIYSTIDISNINNNIIRNQLSIDEILSYKQYNFVLNYHRMSINDKSFNGIQPFINPIPIMMRKYTDLKYRPKRRLLCNGEIYNYNQLKEDFLFDEKELSSNSDVEIILPLYINKLTNLSVTLALKEVLNLLDGEFSFILLDNIETYFLSEINIFCVKDFFGSKSMYYVKDIENDIFMFVSEIKALPKHIINNKSYIIENILPGHYWSFKSKTFEQYYDLEKYYDLNNCTINHPSPEILENMYSTIRNILITNIHSRYPINNKLGVLISGSFDSSLLSIILIQYMISNNINIDNIEFFTISSKNNNNNDDNNYVLLLLNYIKNKFNVTVKCHVVYLDDIDIIIKDLDKIVYSLESYDPDLIRDSIPFYYLMKYIKTNSTINILFTGDGLSQICGDDSFINLNNQLFQNKSIDYIKNMYNYNLLRTDKLSGQFSIEIRQPYITKNFIEYMLSIHPKIKRENINIREDGLMSKYILRKAFDPNIYEEILPNEILWRKSQKINNTLQNLNQNLDTYFKNSISKMFFNYNLSILISENQNKNTLPKTNEELHYRLLFRKFYPNNDSLINNFWRNI